TIRVTIISATGTVRPGRTFELKKTIAGFDLGSTSRASPRRTTKRNRPVTNMADASVASIAGISTKAISQPLAKPTSAIAMMVRMMAGGPDSPALISVLNVVAPATMAATKDKSRPREMMTTAIPQLRITREVELERMTRRLPGEAKPLIVRENKTIIASVTARTIGSSRLRRGWLPNLTFASAVASDMKAHLVGAFGLQDLAGLVRARDLQRQLFEDPANLEHLRR